MVLTVTYTGVDSLITRGSHIGCCNNGLEPMLVWHLFGFVDALDAFLR